jgi:hypothetical protein
MKLPNHSLGGKFLAGFALALLFSLLGGPLPACTIFVLTDPNRALFCNNEDFSNPKTRIWFLPAAKGHYGCAYVGYDDGWGQGGLNTEGLAYDWVAGYSEAWQPDPSQDPVRGNGNPSEEMLETCATVEEAIAYYRSHQEPAFSYARILIADKTGASVIIGAQNGLLEVQRDDRCRGFGYGENTLATMLAQAPAHTVAKGFEILKACRQGGKYATKYSNIYDLKAGEIFLYPSPNRDDMVEFNLAAELKKGSRYYDMPRIHDELGEAPRPLPEKMKRRRLEDLQPIPDRDPAVTARVRAILQDAANGHLDQDDFSPAFWAQVSLQQAAIQKEIRSFGELRSLLLVERGSDDGHPSYRYVMRFSKATVLQSFVFGDQNKAVTIKTDGMVWLPGAQSPVNWQEIADVGMHLKPDQPGARWIIDGVLSGSPAEMAGIKPGSWLLSVDGVNLTGKKAEDLIGLIRGKPGTTVKLEIANAELRQTNTFTLRREILHVKFGVSEAPN